MILTVTFSPALDYVVALDKLEVGQINRTNKEKFMAGGKGINVSIVLSNLGVKNSATGFLAGFVGNYIESEVKRFGIGDEFVWVDGVSRINVKLRGQVETAINGQGPMISSDNIEELMTKIEKLGKNDILVVSGAIPKTLPSDTYENILKHVDENCKVIIDTTKDNLLKTLKYKPFLVKPNKEELEELFNTKIDDNEIVSYCKKILDMGAENVICSMGQQGAVLVSNDYPSYMVSVPKGELVNSVGAGDSLVAGAIYGYLKTNDLRIGLKIGVACGSASAYSEELATKEEVFDLLSKME